MRLSKTKVVQFVESTLPTLVVVDEETSAEVELTAEEVVRLMRAIEYFSNVLGVGVTTISAELRRQSDNLLYRADHVGTRDLPGMRLAASILRVRAAQVEHELLMEGRGYVGPDTLHE